MLFSAAFAIGIKAENLFEVYNRKKFGTYSPTRRGTPKKQFK